MLQEWKRKIEEERKREQDIEMEMQRKRDQIKWLQHVSKLKQYLTEVFCSTYS